MIDSAENRNRVIIRTSVIGILANIMLVIFKAAVGLLSHSIAIILDAVNNLSDALSSVITIVGAKLANKLPDKKHPLGYGRIEYLSAMIVSAIVLYAGITSLVESVKKIIHPEEADYGWVTLVILAAAIVVKLVLGRYVKAQGKKVNSGSLIASGSDALFDAILSASVLACAILYLTTGLALEAYVGVVISAMIIKSGIEMMVDTLNDILGQRSDPELSRRIKQLVCEEEGVRGAYDLNLLGMNVTVPYKSAVIPFLRDIDPSAEKIGAVNTLVRVDGGYKGYNTDCSGIGSALNANGVCFPADQTYGRNGLIRTDTVVMIGAGGAAKAACYMCGEKGVRKLIILNRSVEHAARLAETVQKDFPSMAVSSMPLSKAPEIRENGFLAIQCTKAGLTPKVNETPVADRAFFQKAAAVYDVIYNPEETLFLRLARQEGTPGWCGLDMLLQQGISAFKLWTGIKPGEEQVEKVREHLWTTLY